MGAVPEPTVSVTFDNLGEAAQLELGMWPEDVPIGEHFTVVDVLPRLLHLLAKHHMRATFFLEGLNAEMYPRALQGIAAAGHEVAVHAYRHEEWASLDADVEAELLRRATDAMRALDVSPLGFRPPGGGLTARTLALLGEHGYTYVSPAGEREGLLEGLAVLPFRWQLVDAYFYLPQFASLRERYGEGPNPLTPKRMQEAMLAALAAHVGDGEGHLTLLFHPLSFAFTGDAGWEALDSVLGHAARYAATGALTVMRMDEAAANMLVSGKKPTPPPLLDDTTWMTQ